MVDTVDAPVRIAVCSRPSTAADRYALLWAIRQFERSLLELFETGVLSGTTHTCIGEETVAVGVVSAIDRDRDVVFSNHRGHGHFLAYCGEIERLYLELMGKPDGLCGGRGGSQHLQYGNFYSNGVQGGIVPVATGMALAERHRRSGAVAVVFLGDGTLGEGVVYESFNIAALWRLPIVFVIDHNGYAQSTAAALQIAGDVLARPEAFGIAARESVSADVDDIFAVAADAIDRARAGDGPQSVVCRTYRLAPHSKGDDTRPADEVAAAWTRDPLLSARARLADPGLAGRIEQHADDLVRTARERALRR